MVSASPPNPLHQHSHNRSCHNHNHSCAKRTLDVVTGEGFELLGRKCVHVKGSQGSRSKRLGFTAQEKQTGQLTIWGAHYLFKYTYDEVSSLRFIILVIFTFLNTFFDYLPNYRIVSWYIIK
jgi:hypothetical protein